LFNPAGLAVPLVADADPAFGRLVYLALGAEFKFVHYF
jgi:hypothetical protein